MPRQPYTNTGLNILQIENDHWNMYYCALHRNGWIGICGTIVCGDTGRRRLADES